MAQSAVLPAGVSQSNKVHIKGLSWLRIGFEMTQLACCNRALWTKDKGAVSSWVRCQIRLPLC